MKFIKKLKNKLNNRGSSIVMVVVALGFIGIIVGALLSAAGYAYRLKLQQKNAQDNFYYVEQAMQEIYAGVGTHTIEEMKSAYTYTLENMVRFDTKLGTYVTISDEEANQMFKSQFMMRIKNSSYFNQGTDTLADSLENFISNETVKLDKGKLSVIKRDSEIIIKDVTLTRTQEYAQSVAEGTYTQTISADIVISEPDFDVKFNNLHMDYSAIFDYAMVADMGIEINQNSGTNLAIQGNLYAASDYYNKSYNGTLNEATVNEGDLQDKDFTLDGSVMKGSYTVTGETEPVKFEYDFSSVTNKTLTSDDEKTGYVNDYAQDAEKRYLPFDGLNDNSKYSGLYINNSNVSIMADNIIVPGTLAVMNESNLDVYGSASASTLTQIWADDIVLGGSSTKNTEKSTTDVDVYDGSTATFHANLFVKDDTELNADGSSFTLSGSYYGYGDGTSRDSRVFFDTVDKYYFMMPELDENGNVVAERDSSGNIVTDENGNAVLSYAENRGHFNSSSIIINGQKSNLDLSNTEEIYIAGRAYVELSRYGTEQVTTEDEKTTKTVTYQYLPSNTERTNFVEDYKTGESISGKSSQLIYVVSGFGKVSNITNGTAGTNFKYDSVEIPDTFDGVGYDDDPNDRVVGFGDFFPKTIFVGRLPVKVETVKNRQYVLIDFDTAYELITEVAAMQGNSSISATELAARKAAAQAILDKYPTVDDYQSAYAVFYAAESLKGDSSVYYPDITGIYAYSDFNFGDITMPTLTTSAGDTTFTNTVYSSGAISVKIGDQFTMTTVDNMDGNNSVINALLSDPELSSYSTARNEANEALKALNFSDDLDMEYIYMKWNLAHYEANDIEKSFVQDVVKVYGEDSLTPINKYMAFENFANKPLASFEVKDYVLNSEGDSGVTYRLWATESDIEITGTENITGIIITKGDVTFGDDVKSFTGMIVSGGKIYVGKNMTSISAAPATCREILRQCIRSEASECQYFLKLFKEYEDITSDPDITIGEGSAVGIDTVGFSDVVSIDNWMKNVGGAYDTN